jgi:hypothetical protein
LLAAALAFAACSSHAWRSLAAPDDADAEALITRGIELREHGKDDEALGVFKKALATTPSPRARAQVALAEQALGLWVAAEVDLVQALAASNDAWITRNRAALEGALAVVRRHLGTLEVRGTEGAEVVLDGVSLGKLPSAAPFRVEAGKRTLELRAKGFHATTRSVEVPAGAVARETVVLVAAPPDSPADGAGTTRHAPSANDDRGARDEGRGQRVLGWVLAGTGGALLVTGGVGLLVRKSIVDGYNDDCPGLGVGQPADCDDKIESARTWLTLSIVSLVGGGLFAAGGLTLVATAPRAARSKNDARPARPASVAEVGCAPATLRGGAWLTCTGSF